MTTQPLVTILTTPNFPLPEPTSYSGTTSTLTEGGLSVSGKLLSSVVRKDIAKIALSWNYLDSATWARINQIFKDNYTNIVRFYNQTTGSWDERNMYASDRNAGLWRRDNSGTVLGWVGCGLQLMEV